MAQIDDDEEFACDWDWFAVDTDGHIGHFTTAGLRPLPKSVKRDKKESELLIQYFEKSKPTSNFLIRPQAKFDSGGWGLGGKDRYIKSFADMSTKGLFSYDTEMIRAPIARYYLVTVPERPLQIDEVPDVIRKLLRRTMASVKFVQTGYIPESETLSW